MQPNRAIQKWSAKEMQKDAFTAFVPNPTLLHVTWGQWKQFSTIPRLVRGSISDKGHICSHLLVPQMQVICIKFWTYYDGHKRQNENIRHFCHFFVRMSVLIFPAFSRSRDLLPSPERYHFLRTSREHNCCVFEAFSCSVRILEFILVCEELSAGSEREASIQDGTTFYRLSQRGSHCSVVDRKRR